MEKGVCKLAVQPAAHADVIHNNACSRQHMHSLQLAMHVAASTGMQNI